MRGVRHIARVVMTLPADIARCDGSHWFWEVMPECQDCARMEKAGLDRVVMMNAPAFVDGKCPMKIDAVDHG